MIILFNLDKCITQVVTNDKKISVPYVLHTYSSNMMILTSFLVFSLLFFAAKVTAYKKVRS